MIPEEWDGATSSSRCVCKRCAVRVPVLSTDPQHGLRPQRPPLQARRRKEGQRTNRPGGGRPVSVWTDDKLRELLRLTNDGLTSREVAEVMGTRADTVRKYLGRAKKLGLAVAAALVAASAWQLTAEGGVAGYMPPEAVAEVHVIPSVCEHEGGLSSQH